LLPPEGASLPPDGASLPPDGASLPPDGASLQPDGAFLFPGKAKPRDLLDRGVSEIREWELATLSSPVDGPLAPGLSARRPSPRRCSPRQAEYPVSQQDRPTAFARAAY